MFKDALQTVNAAGIAGQDRSHSPLLDRPWFVAVLYLRAAASIGFGAWGHG